MDERKRTALAAITGWRIIVVYLISIVAATSLALWLIPQLSREAAIRGAMIATAVFLATRLGLWLSLRARQSKP
jgi:hypothetical protein